MKKLKQLLQETIPVHPNGGWLKTLAYITDTNGHSKGSTPIQRYMIPKGGSFVAIGLEDMEPSDALYGGKKWMATGKKGKNAKNGLPSHEFVHYDGNGDRTGERIWITDDGLHLNED